jgi:hypothetical protein
MNLDHLSCTGIDDTTDLNKLLDLQQEFADRLTVEWGILVMKGKKGGKYPSKATLARTKAFVAKGLNVCVHLCGASAKDVLKGQTLPPELQGFGRFQLNIGSYQKQWDPDAHPVKSFRIPLEAHYKLQSGKNPWVIETLAPDFEKAGYRVSILLDTSRGRGKKGQNWGLASTRFPTGFAGGLSAHNLQTKVKEISSQHQSFFLCTESALRTEDRFDLRKIRACIEACLIEE